MKIYKYETAKADGRKWIQYDDVPFPDGYTPEDTGISRPDTWQAPHVRYNAMRDEWVAISASRQDRPFLPPKEYCPLCPQKEVQFDSSGNEIKTEIPRGDRGYKWAVFENIFPGLSLSGEPTGHCEVVLYSPEHTGTLGDCDENHIKGLVHVWQDRSRSIGEFKDIKQVFIFENKGPEIGVTLHHPHGQIYSFTEVPPFLKKEQEVAARHYEEKGSCLVCDLVTME